MQAVGKNSVSGNDGVANATVRTIKVTPRYIKMFNDLSTEGWIHVIPSKGRWRVRKHGAARARGIYDDKDTAIAEAKKYRSSMPDVYIYIHDSNGNVEQTIHE